MLSYLKQEGTEDIFGDLLSFAKDYIKTNKEQIISRWKYCMEDGGLAHEILSMWDKEKENRHDWLMVDILDHAIIQTEVEYNWNCDQYCDVNCISLYDEQCKFISILQKNLSSEIKDDFYIYNTCTSPFLTYIEKKIDNILDKTQTKNLYDSYSRGLKHGMNYVNKIVREYIGNRHDI